MPPHSPLSLPSAPCLSIPQRRGGSPAGSPAAAAVPGTRPPGCRTVLRRLRAPGKSRLRRQWLRHRARREEGRAAAHAQQGRCAQLSSPLAALLWSEYFRPACQAGQLTLAPAATAQAWLTLEPGRHLSAAGVQREPDFTAGPALGVPAVPERQLQWRAAVQQERRRLCQEPPALQRLHKACGAGISSRVAGRNISSGPLETGEKTNWRLQACPGSAERRQRVRSGTCCRSTTCSIADQLLGDVRTPTGCSAVPACSSKAAGQGEQRCEHARSKPCRNQA